MADLRVSYCTGCGRPHDGECGRLTLPERLDAAENGAQFAQVLTGLFAALDKARWADDDN